MAVSFSSYPPHLPHIPYPTLLSVFSKFIENPSRESLPSVFTHPVVNYLPNPLSFPLLSLTSPSVTPHDTIPQIVRSSCKNTLLVLRSLPLRLNPFSPFGNVCQLSAGFRTHPKTRTKLLLSLLYSEDPQFFLPPLPSFLASLLVRKLRVPQEISCFSKRMRSRPVLLSPPLFSAPRLQ